MWETAPMETNCKRAYIEKKRLWTENLACLKPIPNTKKIISCLFIGSYGINNLKKRLTSGKYLCPVPTLVTKRQIEISYARGDRDQQVIFRYYFV